MWYVYLMSTTASNDWTHPADAALSWGVSDYHETHHVDDLQEWGDNEAWADAQADAWDDHLEADYDDQWGGDDY